MTNRIKLVVAYDGTDFCGWAANAGLRTVQGTLTKAVHRVSGEDCEIVGASRTDSGAHAKGQVCHFDSNVAIPPQDWRKALNRILDQDVQIMESKAVADDFHSRFCAQARHYRYRIALGNAEPFQLRYAHQWRGPLNIEEMQKAASELVGEHDFKAFSQDLDLSQTNTFRTLYSVQVSRAGNEVRIDIAGTAFVRGMMRRISGALMEVGRGRRPVTDIQGLLSNDRDRYHWPEVLPAKGLTLMRITYGRHPKDHRAALEEELND